MTNQADLDSRGTLEDGANNVHVWRVPEEGLHVLVPNVDALQKVADVTNLPDLHPQDDGVDGSLGGVLEAFNDLWCTTPGPTGQL